MTGRVEGKVAFITGAARGQGRTTAVRLAEEGADIIAIDLCKDIETVGYALATPADLEETVRLVEKTGRRIVALQADVRERAELVDAVKQGIDAFGHLDIVVANAAVCSMGSHQRESDKFQTWVDGVDTDLLGVINAVHAAMPHLSDGASLIATGSMAAFMNMTGDPTPGQDPGASAYNFSKQTLAAFMFEVARNVAPRMMRANVVHPTNCNTDMLHSDPMYRAFRPDLENPTREDAVVAFPAQQAMPIPFIEPSDVTNAILFLASDESRYVTGMQMRVDAGSYLKFNNFSV